MKKSLLTLLAIFLFAGVSNFIVEPAYAQAHGHHESHEAESEGECDVPCYASHLFWHMELQQTSFEQPFIQHKVLSLLLAAFPTPPLKGIFHPPTTL